MQDVQQEGTADEDLEQVPEEKRLRKDLVDCFLANDLSAKRTARIMKNAQAAGAEGLKDLQFKNSKNVSRDMLRKIFRNTKWPSPYEFQATAFKEAENKCEQQTMSILLPHEFLFALLRVNDPEVLIAKQEEILPDRPDLIAHMSSVASLGFRRDDTILAGLWVDAVAVPFNSDRSRSLQVMTLSLCGHQSLRIPLCSSSKDMTAKQQTFEDIFEVVAWSFRVLLNGTMPDCRHDGAPFGLTDAYRRKHQGKTVQLKACLAEMRSDWAGYKEVLDFPSWSSKGHICWRCNCQRDSLKRFEDDTLERLPDLIYHFFSVC